jgi:AcrR family transcriptional regulator
MAPRTQAERSGLTSARLTAAARRLFGLDGYAATSIDAIAAAAGVTKGAAYHHFHDKAGLLRAAFVEEQRLVCDAVTQAAAAEPDSLAALRSGAAAFLERCTNRTFRQIVLLDGPAFLGWDTVRAIEGDYVLRVLTGGIRAAAADGLISAEHLDIRSQIIFGGLCEAGMLLARSADPAATLPVVTAEAQRMLRALAGSEGPEGLGG